MTQHKLRHIRFSAKTGQSMRNVSDEKLLSLQQKLYRSKCWDDDNKHSVTYSIVSFFTKPRTLLKSLLFKLSVGYQKSDGEALCGGKSEEVNMHSNGWMSSAMGYY
ncbi:hypothetical protein KIN20_018392 [Parelaphostrongylus tenuis]|uniref:Uncharacterized protein n=1 Tax=Parelaphostrongylus tenuis TaxID=148309 RepID=A0AAD5MMY5_PARTN|nr:hypothetical protein KIN20_018392 [Parelaphostrongylus tenuis]